MSIHNIKKSFVLYGNNEVRNNVRLLNYIFCFIRRKCGGMYEPYYILFNIQSEFVRAKALT